MRESVSALGIVQKRVVTALEGLALGLGAPALSVGNEDEVDIGSVEGAEPVAAAAAAGAAL